MPTGRARSSASRFAHVVEQRWLDECLHALHATGWEQRLAPLAQHMTTQRLVRARGYAGGHLRQLDLTLLREVLSGLLREQCEAGSLIVQLLAESQEPATVAAERGVSRASGSRSHAGTRPAPACASPRPRSGAPGWIGRTSTCRTPTY